MGAVNLLKRRKTVQETDEDFHEENLMEEIKKNDNDYYEDDFDNDDDPFDQNSFL